MIEGIHCDVKHEEMLGLLNERINHHAEKHAFYVKQVENFEKMNEGERGGSVDVVRDSKHRRAEHEKHVQFLTFIRDHLVEGETYRLSESDMVRLGFVRSQY